MTDSVSAREVASPAAAAEVVERVVANLELAVRAPRETLELCVLGLLAEGPSDHRGLPGGGEDGAREVARALAPPLLLPTPVHARPAADRRHRRQRLQPEDERVRVPAGARVHERPARGRDQPRVAEDAVGAARGDAGVPGHDRRRSRTRSSCRSSSSRRRTRSSTRARTRSRRRSSTASPRGSRSATRRSPRRRACSRSRRPTRRSTG